MKDSKHKNNNVDCSCVVCDKPLQNIMENNKGFQPMGGLAFATGGHFGTTKFDPMDGSMIELCICDECVEKAKNKNRILHYKAQHSAGATLWSKNS